MSKTIYVEQREAEQWQDVTDAFMRFCVEKKGMTRGGCHEGDPLLEDCGRVRFASISMPDHCQELVRYLKEWARHEGRQVKE